MPDTCGQYQVRACLLGLVADRGMHCIAAVIPRSGVQDIILLYICVGANVFLREKIEMRRAE